MPSSRTWLSRPPAHGQVPAGSPHLPPPTPPGVAAKVASLGIRQESAPLANHGGDEEDDEDDEKDDKKDDEDDEKNDNNNGGGSDDVGDTRTAATRPAHAPALVTFKHQTDHTISYVSESSTPTRTRSTSSSNSTPHSTLPSTSTSSRARPLAGYDNDDNSGAPLVHRIERATTDDGASDPEDAAHDHVPFAHLHHSYYPHDPPATRPVQSPSPPPPPPPHSLLACPPSCLRSRARVRRSASQSRSRSRSRSHNRNLYQNRNQTGNRSRIQSSRERTKRRTNSDVTDAQAHLTDHAAITSCCGTNNDVVRNADNSADDDGNDDGDDDAVSLGSHALAWDQTCLRIAYLVSTMVTPSGASAGGSGHGGTGDQAMPVAPPATAAAAAAVALTAGTLTTDAPGAANGDASELKQSSGLIGYFADQCPRGWMGVESHKKRRKIVQVLVWLTEVDKLGDDTCCACSTGTASQIDVLETGQANAAVADGGGGTAAPPFGPRTTHTTLCPQCGHPLAPQRPVVWVGASDSEDDLLKRLRRPQESAAEGLRKAFRGIRGLVARKKRNSPYALSAKNGSSLDQSVPGGQGLWDQWDELNCQRLFRAGGASAAQFFFPQTAMYQDHQDATAQAATAEAAMTEAVEGTAAAIPIELSTSSVTTSDDNRDDPRSRELRQQREMKARLRRAEQLLAKKHAAPNPTAVAHPVASAKE
ncbi:hypothetical protein SPI_01863 [Niveomyces insectorum RCEF 264]|uniref:Uncharacterized protein n=1 Tax=Niveomyces insectorum RCEF 264 TaxID=1081102 RepID=A0A167ZAU4_9HYPO|nr:hypothetical protein SPI_01863 [Niveomyces insectorum RCEF 264]